MTTRVLSKPTSANFYFKWLTANALAELLGLGGVALLVVLLMPRLETGLTFAVALALFAAVAFEGLCVGAAQWWVLSQWLELRARDWLGFTVLGGTAAWLIGMVAGSTLTFGSETATVAEPGLAFTLLLAGLMGLGLGGILGTAQWFVLRHYVRGASWWLLANALAWAVGMVIIFAATASLALMPSTVSVVTAVIVALLLTGGVVGAIHGFFLIWLVRKKVSNS
jgi:hypothetical protein